MDFTQEARDYAATLIGYKARQHSRHFALRRYTSNDIEQMLWRELLARLARYNPARASINTFIARVVDHAIASLYRHELAEMRSPDREEVSLNDPVLDGDGRVVDRHQTTPEASVDWQRGFELKHDLAEVRRRLPSELHRQFLDAWLRGGTINSIAAELGIGRTKARRLANELWQACDDAGLRDYLQD